MDRLAWLLAALLLSATAFSAPAPEDGPRLIEDIELLKQLVPLQLTLAQIDGVLGIYKQLGVADPETAFNEKTLQELNDVRARLLRGEGMTREDTTVFNGVLKLSGAAKWRARYLPQIEAALRQVLSPTQMLMLRQPQIPDRAADRTEEQIARANLKMLLGAVGTPDEDWPAVRRAAVEGLALGIANPAEKADAMQALPAFLDRLREMGPDEIVRQVEELSGDLQALMPGGMGLLTPDALVPPRGGKAQDRASFKALALFASPALPRVLLEMKAALEQ